ncbi:MAG: serine/threonine protein kinase [Planctomycetes bacterium]|nr:serine/threonine protein kinase [Planctomycetota bacterium]
MPELSHIDNQASLRITRKIAEGGMGAVYQAVQLGVEGFEKTVAIKTIIEDYSQDEEFVQLFIGEAKLVADLIHQNIVQVYQLGRIAQAMYIIMEYVEGINLEQFIDRHRELGRQVPIEIAAYIASRVCRGLEYAHKRTDSSGALLGVVHRDISPKNVMATALGEIKITDFGIAKARNLMSNREGEVLMGKVQYMSPEQAQFEQTDRRSDIFSLGIVLWEILALREMHDASLDTQIILERVRSAPVPDIKEVRPDVPDMLEKILKQALARDLDKRYQDAGQMGYDLEYFMYHKGYGPTIVTMERYLAEIFPDLGSVARRRATKSDLEKKGDTFVTDNPGGFG